MKQTIITTIEATDITDIDVDAETYRIVYERGARSALQKVGIGADDLRVRVQVFEHGESNATAVTEEPCKEVTEKKGMKSANWIKWAYLALSVAALIAVGISLFVDVSPITQISLMVQSVGCGFLSGMYFGM